MKNKIYNVVLSGGIGSRLWPLSRKKSPKQFLKLFKGKSLFQHTLDRNKSIIDDYLLVTNNQQYAMAVNQAEELKIRIGSKVIEPVGRNTAPAIALAALSVEPDDILFVTPSDHMIQNNESYKEAFRKAVDFAEKGYIVTFGVEPTKPETGYGYIEYDDSDVLSFREKPNLETAKRFIKKGNFCWNSGMFCFKAKTLLSELEKYSLKMYTSVAKAHKSTIDGEVPLELMKQIPENSIDFAVLEKTSKIKMVHSHFSWYDLGSFDSLIDYATVHNSPNSVKQIQSEYLNDSYAITTKDVFIAPSLGDVVVVETDDVIMVVPRNKTEEVRDVVKGMKQYYPEHS